MSSAQPGRTVKTRRHLHYVLRTGTPEPQTPTLDSVESWNWAVRISVVGLFVLALAVIAFKMASVVVPVVLAWVVAMVLLPVIDGLERRGLSRALTSIVVVILLIASIMVIVGVLTVPLTYWLRRGSELGALLKERLETLGNPLAFFDEIGNALSQVTGRDEGASAVNLSSSNIVTVILSVLTPLVSETLIFLVSLVFNLIYHRQIQNGMLLPFQNDSARQIAKEILKDIQVNTSIYFGTLTVVNICLGIAATVLTWLVGLPHPFLWGTLAAVLNFIPYVGAAIVIVTLFVVGLIVFSALSHAVIAPLAYLGITALEGQLITPTPSSVIASRSIHFSFSSPSHAGAGCGDRSARSWACPFSCARWWRCAGCHRQAARMPAYIRLLRKARRADGALPSGTMMTTTCSADGSVGPILKLHAAPVGSSVGDRRSFAARCARPAVSFTTRGPWHER